MSSQSMALMIIMERKAKKVIMAMKTALLEAQGLPHWMAPLPIMEKMEKAKQMKTSQRNLSLTERP